MERRNCYNCDININIAVVGMHTHTHNKVTFSVTTMYRHVTVQSGMLQVSRRAKEHTLRHLSFPRGRLLIILLRVGLIQLTQSVLRSKHTASRL